MKKNHFEWTIGFWNMKRQTANCSQLRPSVSVNFEKLCVCILKDTCKELLFIKYPCRDLEQQIRMKPNRRHQWMFFLFFCRFNRIGGWFSSFVHYYVNCCFVVIVSHVRIDKAFMLKIFFHRNLVTTLDSYQNSIV